MTNSEDQTERSVQLNSKLYIGTKRVMAKPMTLNEYNDYRDFKREEEDKEGYLVEYVYSENSNDPRHSGYISWSPKKEFEEAYQTTFLNFSHALDYLKTGSCLARITWEVGTFIYYSKIQTFESNDRLMDNLLRKNTEFSHMPYIGLYRRHSVVGVYTPTHEDMFGNDWEIVRAFPTQNGP